MVFTDLFQVQLSQLNKIINHNLDTRSKWVAIEIISFHLQINNNDSVTESRHFHLPYIGHNTNWEYFHWPVDSFYIHLIQFEMQ